MRRLLAALARLVRAGLALVTLGGFTAAVPWLLTVVAGWPLGWLGWAHPDTMPSLDDLVTAVTSAWSDQMVLAALATCGWILWAIFVRDVVVEILLVLADAAEDRAGRPRPAENRRRGPVRWVAAVLVGAILGAVLFDAARAGLGARPATAEAATNAAAHRPAVAVAAARPAAQAGPGTGGVATTRTVTTSPAATTTMPVTVYRDADRVPAWTENAPGGVHHVVEGDNLWDIAQAKLGDPYRWREIYLLNRGQPQANGYALTDPDMIHIGWVLALPARDPAAVSPPVPQPPATDPAPSGPSATSPAPSTRTDATSAAPSPAPSDTATTSSQNDSGDGVYAPRSPSTSTAPSSAAASPSGAVSPSMSNPASTTTGAGHGAQAPSASRLDGVDLPGGWITLGLGGGLLAAVAMVWRRRRHHYQPTPITSPQLDDPDLLPPLAAMTRVRASLRRAAPETLDEQPAPAPTVREYRAALVKPELPPVGPGGTDLAGATTLPLSTGLGLTGDGALDAARGLLVATLASGSDDDPDAKGRVIIPAATLATLLGVAAVDLGHLDRLTVAASQAHAITQLEEELIRRFRVLSDAEVADVQTLRDTDVHAEPLPQLLLITEPPDPARANRLVTAVRLGHSVDIGAAVIGGWPTGTTLTVAADGTTGNDDAPHLAVLDTAATIDMLGMLREAHGDSGSPARTQPSGQATPPTPAPAGPDMATDCDTTPEHHTPPQADTPPDTTAPAATSRQLVELRVLGHPAVLNRDGQPSPGIRSKAIELLVYLAVNRRGADLSDIMEALYPDATMRRAGERLSTVASDLRKHIRQAAIDPTDTDAEQASEARLEPVPNTGSRYHLDPSIVGVDWWTVLDQYEAVATATDDDQRLSHLTAAIQAARGALAEGVNYDWIDTDREVVRRHRIKLHAHAAALLADTDPHRSWLLLEQACQIDPLSDELARTTMRAAAALGDADAIRHRLKTLHDALDAHGLELSDETEALARQLLRELQPPPPPPPQ